MAQHKAKQKETDLKEEGRKNVRLQERAKLNQDAATDRYLDSVNKGSSSSSSGPSTDKSPKK